VLLQLTLFTDLSSAGHSDDLADSIDYRALTQAITAYVGESRHYLVEALAEGIAEIAVVAFGAERVRVRVEKPGALAGVGAVGVEIERGREDFTDPGD